MMQNKKYNSNGVIGGQANTQSKCNFFTIKKMFQEVFLSCYFEEQ